MKTQWDGLRVCEKDYDKRHPQDAVREYSTGCDASMGAGGGLDWNWGGRTFKPDLDPSTFIQEPNDAYFTTIPDDTFSPVSLGVQSKVTEFICDYVPELTDVDHPRLYPRFHFSACMNHQNIDWGSGGNPDFPNTDAIEYSDYFVKNLYLPDTYYTVNVDYPYAPAIGGFIETSTRANPCLEISGTLLQAPFTGSSLNYDLRPQYLEDSVSGNLYIRTSARCHLNVNSVQPYPGNSGTFFTQIIVVGDVPEYTGTVIAHGGNSVGVPANTGFYRHFYDGQWWIGYILKATDDSLGYTLTEDLIFRGVPVDKSERAVILRAEMDQSGFRIVKNGGEYTYQTNVLHAPAPERVDYKIGYRFGVSDKYFSGDEFNKLPMNFFECLLFNDHLGGTSPTQDEIRRIEEFLSWEWQVSIATSQPSFPSLGSAVEYTSTIGI
jgi:hypothetical protein